MIENTNQSKELYKNYIYATLMHPKNEKNTNLMIFWPSLDFVSSRKFLFVAENLFSTLTF
jgi:hypothetical protein